MSDTTHKNTASYVREEMLGEAAPPSSSVGVVHWVRQNLFADWFNALLTILVLYALYLILPALFKFAIADAVWSGTDRTACATEAQGGVQPNGWTGACWAYVGAFFNQFIYGRYPDSEQWRVNIVFIMFFGGLAPLLMPTAPFKRANIFFMSI
ncbi:MAG: amino acid ABC transporter permease, partial [Pseudomonadota bacterium]